MDFEARKKAIHPDKSFIVQAPAGSGKTELLTQRLLALLPTVDEPEQIVALTFTRKAASEMLHRVLQALKDAQNQLPLKSEHQKTTRELALAALEHANTRSWGLLEHPQRLKIKTFDSFCMEIYKAIPKEEFASLSELKTDTAPIYRQAIQAWFNLCRADERFHAPLKCLIQQAQNRLEILFRQLSELLAKRDQWLPIIGQNREKTPDEHILSLQILAKTYWENWSQTLPQDRQKELIALIAQYHEYVPDGFPELKNLQDFDSIRPQELHALRKLLLTANSQIRKAFDQHVGALQKKPIDPRYKLLKDHSQDVLETLTAYPDFIENIRLLCQLPHPEEVSIHWENLEAYYTLLPLLVACLHMEFEAKECMDYIYIAQQAIFALDQTDLGLYFDNHLQHLLIDEFQDTSWVQLELIQTLTEPWRHQDTTKTLFLVGDPMQSIYRFRSADVGIFLKVQQQGLGDLQLEPLYLRQNFRSNTHLIEHFNQTFKNIFPQKEYIAQGAVTFHPAHPVIPAQEDCFVRALYYADEKQQTQAIIEILKKAQTHQDINVAILVRSRSRLPSLLKALENEHFNFTGIDLFPLSDRLHIRDLWNLSKLFLEPGQRVHELAVLRSPLCGLSLIELEQLASTSDNLSILSQITHPSPRLAYFLDCYQNAYRQRQQKPLVELIQTLALELSFFKTLNTDQEKEALHFFQIIEQSCDQHIWPSTQEIQDKLNQTLVSSSGRQSLQIMTIHKSKGLEFDWVILPDMGSASRGSSTGLIHWQRSDDPRHWQIIPQQEPCHQLLSCLEDKQEYYELQRLAYVAFTRAKKRLYCFDSQEKAADGSFRRLFAQNYFQKSEHLNITEIDKKPETYWYRITESLYIQEKKQASHLFQNGSNFENHLWSKHIGIVSHRILQWICQYHPRTDSEIPWQILNQQLKTLGYSEKEQAIGLKQVQHLIQTFWRDPIGQWIRKPRDFEKNEFSLLIRDGEIVRNAIIDRTFIENNILWIIDFKTHTEHEKYQQQLNHYAEALHILYPTYPISCGLFYLSTATWKTWTPNKLEQKADAIPIL